MNRPENPTPIGASADVHPLFDAMVLGDMFGSETAVIASVLQTFVKGTHGNLAALAQALAAQDLATVASLAHTITGACRMSGAQALGHTARGIEQAAKQGDMATVQRYVLDVNAQWPLTLAAISAMTDAVTGPSQ